MKKVVRRNFSGKNLRGRSGTGTIPLRPRLGASEQGNYGRQENYGRKIWLGGVSLKVSARSMMCW